MTSPRTSTVRIILASRFYRSAFVALLLSGGVSFLSARRAATVDPLIALRQ